MDSLSILQSVFESIFEGKTSYRVFFIQHKMNQSRKLLLYELWILLSKTKMSLTRKHYLKSDSLAHPFSSPWREIFKRKDNLAFLNSTGLTFNAFMLLFSKFKKYLPLTSPKKAGRRRLMKSIDVLRLVLQLLNSNMKQKTLAQFFRIVPSSVCLYVNLGLNQLLLVLKNMLNIQVTWPCPIQMKEYSLLIAKREPLLTNTLGFVDGLNLPLLVNVKLQNGAWVLFKEHLVV
ncbi:hypothetical protein BC833DRAFT_569465 [Globomyces pollinis-pini]|nr:hypothetical protein BC833DRAFT_569465 [Globomyces pollinis-pini]